MKALSPSTVRSANSAHTRSRKPVALAAAMLLLGLGTGPEAGRAAATEDWPMWGGTPDRNMISSMTGVPTDWDTGSGENVKWEAALGSQTYGNPVVAGGSVFVGTNNEALYDPEMPGDAGVLLAFDEASGEFLWQHFSQKLAAGRVNDWPYQGICSSPLVDGDRLYYVTSRGELVALDTQGFLDGENDGFAGEELSREIDADVVWSYDMMEELGSFPHNMSNSSPVMYGDLLFVSTSNGQDETHVNIPSPRTPAIIAINKNTGELVWEDNSVEDRILHGQWSSAAVGDIGGVVQVVMGQGDGWVRGYVAETGEKLWEFNTNPEDAIWPRTRNNVVATPVIYKNRVYIGNGQDPEHGEGVGHFYAIDGTKRGDITETGRIWHYSDIRRTISTAAIHEDVVYIPDFSGFLHALDADTGAVHFVHDTFAAVWGSALVVEGKVYLGDEDGDVVILEAGRSETVVNELNLGSSVYSSAVPANGALYIASRNKLFAIVAQ